jgi:type I restriction enzyme S subunit
MQPLPNSIWFAKMKNSIKHITLSSDSEWFNEKYILSTGFLGIKCKEDTLSYLHCFIYSDYFEKVKNMLAHGATQEAINNEDLKAIRLLIPDEQILEFFENYTKAIIQNELDIIRENQRLNSLKEFLLPLLMNGQINVDDIEI